jgi:hypothetical protein
MLIGKRSSSAALFDFAFLVAPGLSYCEACLKQKLVEIKVI